MKSLILAAILRLVPTPTDPTEQVDEYTARLDTIAQAIDDVSAGSPSLAAALVVTAHYESHFDRRIHTGSGHPTLHEDHHRARALYQLHRPPSMDVDTWHALAGDDLAATTRETRLAAQLLGHMHVTCAPGPMTAARFAVVATSFGVGHCTGAASWSFVRAREWTRVVAWLGGGR
jgi:hypothetical protein